MKVSKSLATKKGKSAKVPSKAEKQTAPKPTDEPGKQKTDAPDSTQNRGKEILIKDPSLFLNRDLSWLEFNRRVLEEAEDPETPALEKLKFISIFSSNLDEFFQIRVGALARLIQAGVIDPDPSGMVPLQIMERIAEKGRCYVSEQYQCLQNSVLPSLKQAGTEIHPMESLARKEKDKLRSYFETQVLPILTPLAVDAGHPFPFLGNLKIYLMVMFKEPSDNTQAKTYLFQMDASRESYS